MLWIPAGFAHGFLVLSARADVLYKASDYYSPEHERTLTWNDPQVGIQWKVQAAPIVSAKDQRGLTLREAETFD
jgi:dTDP-4-dehydrorhamnose 3,5-epimerase